MKQWISIFAILIVMSLPIISSAQLEESCDDLVENFQEQFANQSGNFGQIADLANQMRIQATRCAMDSEMDGSRRSAAAPSNTSAILSDSYTVQNLSLRAVNPSEATPNPGERLLILEGDMLCTKSLDETCNFSASYINLIGDNGNIYDYTVIFSTSLASSITIMGDVYGDGTYHFFLPFSVSAEAQSFVAVAESREFDAPFYWNLGTVEE